MTTRKPATTLISAATLLLLAGCTDDGLALLIDLRSDLSPGVEVLSSETRIDGLHPETAAFRVGDPVFDGQRIAEYGGLEPGTHTVEVSLLDSADVVATRRVIVELRESTGLIVLVTRSCVSAECPGTGDEPNLTECYGGRCVEATCGPESPELCGEPACTLDRDCAAGPACANARCVAGACLLVGVDATCAPGERCDVEDGCVEGGLDASTDAGLLPTGTPDCTADAQCLTGVCWDFSTYDPFCEGTVCSATCASTADCVDAARDAGARSPDSASCGEDGRCDFVGTGLGSFACA